MDGALKSLTAEEKEEMYLIPVWVCILMAGADNKIDLAEIRKSIRIIKEEKASLIHAYYKKVAQKFEVNLKGYIALMPKAKEPGVDFLVRKLERVNYFFSILDKEIAYQLYLSFRDLANKVAHASGGFFGLLSVSQAESSFIDLKMITDPSKS